MAPKTRGGVRRTTVEASVSSTPIDKVRPAMLGLGLAAYMGTLLLDLVISHEIGSSRFQFEWSLVDLLVNTYDF